MTDASDDEKDVVEVGYQIAESSDGSWSLTLRVSGLPSGLIADQMGLALVAVVGNALNPATVAQKGGVQH